MKKRIVILGSIFAIMIIIILVFIITHNKHMYINDVKSKYDINKELNELNIKNDKEYREYLKDISVYITPEHLRTLVDYNEFYYSVKVGGKMSGHEVVLTLKNDAYKNLLEIIIQKGQDWSNLPLTENFRKKFNEAGGCINEIDNRPIIHNIKNYSDIDNDSTIEYIDATSLQDFSFDKKTFSVRHDYIPDDAYEKYSEYNIYYMLYYGVGAYNSDRYNYQFVLDEEGYLDDIIFLGITPIIVEGRDLEHPENNVWHDGDE